MSDNDIVKALERCVDERKGCGGCPYSELPHKCSGFHHDILGLINRLKADNAEIKKQYEQVTAVEEFAERLEARLANNSHIGLAEYQFVIGDVNAVIEEMKEGKK